LHRIFRILRENNPSLGLGKKVTLPPPLVFREGSKKTIFANIYDMSVRLHRPLDHFKDYLFAELGTNGSVDGSNRLTLKGRFQQKQLENVVRRYIHEYVTCKTCKSPDTLLAKENRVWFITCESCGSKRSVSAIKTGFQAQTSVTLPIPLQFVNNLPATTTKSCRLNGWVSWIVRALHVISSLQFYHVFFANSLWTAGDKVNLF
jgi:putative translation initiation factor aIF-2 beta subunit